MDVSDTVLFEAAQCSWEISFRVKAWHAFEVEDALDTKELRATLGKELLQPVHEAQLRVRSGSESGSGVWSQGSGDG